MISLSSIFGMYSLDQRSLVDAENERKHRAFVEGRAKHQKQIVCRPKSVLNRRPMLRVRSDLK